MCTYVATCTWVWSVALSLLSQSRCSAAVPAATHRCSLSFPANSAVPESGAESAAESTLSRLTGLLYLLRQDLDDDWAHKVGPI